MIMPLMTSTMTPKLPKRQNVDDHDVVPKNDHDCGNLMAAKLKASNISNQIRATNELSGESLPDPFKDYSNLVATQLLKTL